MLINLANKHNLTRHEDELASNMFIRDVNTQKIVGKAKPSDQLIKKLNIATLKYRPTCTHTGAKCGLRWYQVGFKSYSESNYHAGVVGQAEANAV